MKMYLTKHLDLTIVAFLCSLVVSESGDILLEGISVVFCVL